MRAQPNKWASEQANEHKEKKMNRSKAASVQMNGGTNDSTILANELKFWNVLCRQSFWFVSLNDSSDNELRHRRCRWYVTWKSVWFKTTCLDKN